MRRAVNRASNRGCLSISQDEYLLLLDWSGRSLRAGKQGRLPAELPDILDRLNVSAEGWLSLVSDFSRLFRRAASTPSSLANEAEHRDRAWLHGVRNAQEVFRQKT